VTPDFPSLVATHLFWGKHPHHILPRGQGGKDEIGNLVALHRQCHRSVHEHPIEARGKGFLA
jgi:5-methylcytosine-specific restriction endonuclease McrA